jgi:hypothetical protein
MVSKAMENPCFGIPRRNASLGSESRREVERRKLARRMHLRQGGRHERRNAPPKCSSISEHRQKAVLIRWQRSTHRARDFAKTVV